MNSHFCRFLALAGMLGITLTCDAAEPLRLEQAVARALSSSPWLRANSAELQSAQAQAEHQALPAPFYLAAEIENVAGSGAFSGTDSAETTVRLGKVIELGGKREARRLLGSAEVSLGQHRLALARQATADLTALRFNEVMADQQRFTLASEGVALAENTRVEVARFVELARNPESDLRLAEIALADAELEREHAEHELASARVTLASSWGEWRPDFAAVTGALAPLPEIPPFQELSEMLDQSPSLRRRALEQQIAAARRGLAMAGAKPDLNLSLGVRRLQAFDEHAMVLGASLPLGTTRRARLTEAAASADLHAQEAHREHEFADAQQVLFEKYQELVHARTEHETLNLSMLPKAEQALALTRQGFERGRLPLTTLLQAQQTLFSLRRRSVDAAARFHELQVELRQITGSGKGEQS